MAVEGDDVQRLLLAQRNPKYLDVSNPFTVDKIYEMKQLINVLQEYLNFDLFGRMILEFKGI